MVAGVSPRHTLCRHAPEWWPDMARNTGPAYSGITGRHRPESASRLARLLRHVFIAQQPGTFDIKTNIFNRRDQIQVE
jgi:hypothetical protein